MDALELVKEYNRICKSRPESCEGCPFQSRYSCDTIMSLDEIVPIVEKWSKEHPFIRNVDHVAEGLEKLGFKPDKEYLKGICPAPYSRHFSYASSNCQNPNLYDCKECLKWWLEEYKGAEE